MTVREAIEILKTLPENATLVFPFDRDESDFITVGRLEKSTIYGNHKDAVSGYANASYYNYETKEDVQYKFKYDVVKILRGKTAVEVYDNNED